jgi:hypothetical protein
MSVLTEEFTDGLCQKNPAGLQARLEVSDGQGGVVEVGHTFSVKSTIPTGR